MSAGTNNLLALLMRLKAALVADRRKTVVLTVLLAMGLVLAIRLLLGRTMPKRAVAWPAAQGAPETPAAAQARQVQTPGAPVSEGLLGVDTRITRDLFKVAVGAYPVVVATRASDKGQATRLVLQSIVPGPRPTAIINGLVVGVGDAIKERVAERWVDTGFVLASIEDTACVVTQQGVAVRLEMKNVDR